MIRRVLVQALNRAQTASENPPLATLSRALLVIIYYALNPVKRIPNLVRQNRTGISTQTTRPGLGHVMP
jgi:hypothetical protein